MNHWIPFSVKEVNELCARPKSLEDSNERDCPSCNSKSVRFYYHEFLDERNIGTTWFWCYKCFKYTHFTGQPKSIRFEFNDPISSLFKDEVSFDDLNLFWERGVLPQAFKKK